uniref:ABC transmembrane type-1 domain-containing protein n=1 Tax=Macrostomum lignano TaxID=282301 RepID=A0A1I8FKB9_9PLAT
CGSPRRRGHHSFAIIDAASRPSTWTARRGDKPAHCTGQIELRDVAFKYPTRPDVPWLQGVSFTIQPGQTVALTGLGCGKSSVVKLILRFYDRSPALCSLTGATIRELNVHWYRSRHRAGVSGAWCCSDGSIQKENIRHGAGKEVTGPKEMVAACKQPTAHKFIQPAARPVTTLWFASGAALAPGGRPRSSGLAIARALVRRPTCLDCACLDEATSAWTPISESVVQEALDKCRQGVTTLVIAHATQHCGANRPICILSINRRPRCWKPRLYYQLVSLQTFAGRMSSTGKIKSDCAREANDEGVETGPRTNKPASATATSDKAVSNGHSKGGQRRSPGRDIRAAAAGDSGATRRDDTVLKKFMTYMGIGDQIGRRLATSPLACIGALLNGGGMPIFAVFFAEVIAVFSKVGDAMLQEATFWALMFLVLGGAQLLGNLFMNIGLGVAGERLTRDCAQSTLINPDNSVGAVTTRLANDASNAKGASGVRLAMPLQALFGVCLGLGIALYYGWMLALMIVGWRATKSQKATDKSSEMAGQTAAEAIENLPTVQSLCREPTKRLVGSVLSGVTYGFS